jgi:hypothetical protein
VCRKLFLMWKTPFILERHNFYKSKWDSMIEKLNEVAIEGIQIIFRLYH